METILSTTTNTVIELGSFTYWNSRRTGPEHLVSIGTGTGIVSLVLAASRSTVLSQDEDKASIYATDLRALVEFEARCGVAECTVHR